MSKKFKNKELAARLGVSGTLVSLVLNNKGDQHGIKKETQERVLAMARQMGYFTTLREKEVTPSTIDRPGIVGMIVPSLNDPIVSGSAPFLQKAFASIGIGFTIITKDPDDLRYERMTGSFRKFFSGLILVGEAADDYTIRILRSSDFPFVMLESSCSNLKINSVCTDYHSGAKLIAEHAESLGYKKIAILSDQGTKKFNKAMLDQLEISFSELPGKLKPVFAEVGPSASEDDYNFTPVESLIRPPFSAELIVVTKASVVYSLIRFLNGKKIRARRSINCASMLESVARWVKGFL